MNVELRLGILEYVTITYELPLPDRFLVAAIPECLFIVVFNKWVGIKEKQ